MPWECLAPFCGLAAQGQGFHLIMDGDQDQGEREVANCALITVLDGT